MILVDTSAWVEFDRATGSAADQRVADLIAQNGPLLVTEPVLMDALAGVRSDARAAELRRLLLSSGFAPIDAAADFDAAATIYRTYRRAGVTPRGMVDCLIAAIARRWRSVAPVVGHPYGPGRSGDRPSAGRGIAARLKAATDR